MDVESEQVFDDRPVLAALDRLAAALSSKDRLAWVAEYTADAVFDGGGAAAVRGRPEPLGPCRPDAGRGPDRGARHPGAAP